MIYFIRNQTSGAIKIGYTAGDPATRMRQLQTGHADRLELICSTPGEVADERKLHETFAVSRIGGEWFNPSPLLIQHVELAKTPYPVIGGRTIESVYLAGRMTDGGRWRESIAPGWIGAEGKYTKAEIHGKRSPDVVGPLYWAREHSSNAGDGPHACADDLEDNHGNCTWAVMEPRKVLADRLGEVSKADLLFAWIDSRDCLGTIAEVGFYRRGGGITVVAIPEWDRELWFVCAMADFLVVANGPAEAWWKLWAGKVSKLGGVSDSSEPDYEKEPEYFHGVTNP